MTFQKKYEVSVIYVSMNYLYGKKGYVHICSFSIVRGENIHQVNCWQEVNFHPYSCSIMDASLC